MDSSYLVVAISLADVDAGAVVLVAVSGGADSMALAAATVFESRAAGWVLRMAETSVPLPMRAAS